MFCIKCGAEIPEGARFCIRCGNPIGESPETKNAEPEKSVLPEKTVAVKPVMNEIGKKLESAKPMIDKMGEKLESARPMIDKMGEKLESAKPVIDKMGEKLESAKPVVDKMGEKLESTKPVIGKIANKLKLKPGKKKVIIIGAVAVVLALIMLLKGGGGGAGSGLSSPEEAFDAWMTGFCLHDFDLMLQAEPDFVIEYEGGEAGLRAKLQKNYEDDIAIYPNAGTFKFEATGHTMVEKDRVKEVEQMLCNEYNVDIKISAAAAIDHRLVDLSDGSAGDIGTTGYAFKYKRKWYYLNMQSL